MIRAVLSFSAALVWFFTSSAQAEDASQTAHHFSFTTIDGEEMKLSDYKGKVVLVANVASQCGFTPQYKDLQALWQRYSDKGLVVIGVPSNDFGGQEPGSNADIKQFAREHFSITFPMAAKETVVGNDAHPFYQFAKKETGTSPLWNFHKYIIAPDGRVVDYFSSFTSPTSSKVTTVIEQHLPAKEG